MLFMLDAVRARQDSAHQIVFCVNATGPGPDAALLLHFYDSIGWTSTTRYLSVPMVTSCSASTFRYVRGGKRTSLSAWKAETNEMSCD